MTKVFYLTLAYIVCLISQTEQQRCHTRELDLCVFPTLMAARKSLVPKDEIALNRACRIWQNEQNCIINYEEECVADMHRMIIDIVTSRERRLLNQLCEQDSKMQKYFLKAAPCVSEVLDITRKTCMDNLENMLYLLTGDNLVEGIAAGCCFYERLYSCYTQLLEERCEQNHIPVIEEASQLLYMDVLHAICKSYDPQSEKCIDLLSRNVTNPSEESSYITRMVLLYLKY